MTPKRQRFVEEYLIDLNATAAYLRAGYKGSEAVAAVEAHRLLRNPKVAAAVQKEMDERARKTGLTAERVLEEIGKLAFANMLDYVKVQEDGTAYVDLSKLTRDQAAAIQEIVTEEDDRPGAEKGERRAVTKVRFKLADKGQNLERLGRHLKLFTDKVEHEAGETLEKLLSKVWERKRQRQAAPKTR